MSSEEIKIENHWQDDLLERQADAEFLTGLLAAEYQRTPSMVLALNAEWGAGKTFLLDRWAQDLTQQQYHVMRYNAWENDYSDDPLLSFLVELGENIKTHYGFDDLVIDEFAKKGKRFVKALGKVALQVATKKVLGIAAEDLADLFNGDAAHHGQSDSSIALPPKSAYSIFAMHNEKKAAVKEFKEALKDLVASLNDRDGTKLPLFVLVDELDRCRPDFAVELLESIKHLFNVDGVYFVIALNQGQLQSSIKVLYGNEFNSGMYLKRFFDLEYLLPMPSNEQIIQAQFRKYNFEPDDRRLYCMGGTAVDTLGYICEAMGLMPRDIEQVSMQIFMICECLSIEPTPVYFSYLVVLVIVKHYGGDLKSEADVSNVISKRIKISVNKQTNVNGVKVSGGLKLDRGIGVLSIYKEHYKLHKIDRRTYLREHEDDSNYLYFTRYLGKTIVQRELGQLPFCDYADIVEKAGHLKTLSS